MKNIEKILGTKQGLNGLSTQTNSDTANDIHSTVLKNDIHSAGHSWYNIR